MDLIKESVKKIRDVLENGGCTEGDIFLDVNPDAKNCQFEKGACMTATFGGRSADFTTFDPIRARTKISFMYDAPLDTPATRGAALAIVNAVTGFFCLSRILHACPESCHAPCLQELRGIVGGKQVYCIGTLPGIEDAGAIVIHDPEQAEIILVGCDGIVMQETGDLIGRTGGHKQVLCIGPSLAGASRLAAIGHWCPYGRSS